MSLSSEPIVVPRAVKKKAIININSSASGSILQSILNPKKIAMIKTRIPWNKEVVAPPSVLPIIIFKRETGETRVSFKKPNCLSQMTSIPVKTAENRIVIEIIPGERKEI